MFTNHWTWTTMIKVFVMILLSLKFGVKTSPHIKSPSELILWFVTSHLDNSNDQSKHLCKVFKQSKSKGSLDFWDKAMIWKKSPKSRFRVCSRLSMSKQTWKVITWKRRRITMALSNSEEYKSFRENIAKRRIYVQADKVRKFQSKNDILLLHHTYCLIGMDYLR